MISCAPDARKGTNDKPKIEPNRPTETTTPPVDDPMPPNDDPVPVDDPTPPVDDPTPPGDDPTPPVDDPTPPVDDPTPPKDDPTPPVTPTPIEAWESRGIGGGGALYSATMSPHDPNLVYISTDMSAMFRSVDFGGQWTTLPFTEIQGGVDTEVRFTSDPAVLYTIHRDNNDGAFPMRSADAGQTWSPLADDPTWGEVWSLHADPGSTERVLLAGWDNLYASNNGGQSFTAVYQGADGGAGLRVAGVFFDGNDIYVGTRDGLVVSNDGGTTFNLSTAGGIPANEAIVGLAGGKSNGLVRLLAVTHEAGDVYGGITGADLWGYRGIYRLDSNQQSWAKAGNLPSGEHAFFIGMAANNIDVAYVGGGSFNTGDPIVYKTTDGGGSWASALNTTGNSNIATGWCGSGGDLEWYWAEAALGFAVSPIDPDRVIITDYGFAHVTDDGGASWRSAYTMDNNQSGAGTPKGGAYQGNGLEDTSVWWLTWTGDNDLFAGYSDISGLHSADSGVTWRVGSALGLPHNSTYHVVTHPDGTLYAATSSVHDLYQSTYLEDGSIDGGSGHVIASTDGGASWSTLSDMGHPVAWLALDPADSETLYASVAHSSQGGIYVTHNLSTGADWTKLADPPRTEGHPHNIVVLDDGALVVTFSGRRSNGFTTSSGVFISTDGGNSWQDRSDPGMLRWTRDVVIAPEDPTQSTWYVTVFSHWGSNPNEVGGLYRTTDRGQTWTRISDSYRVESVTVDPKNHDVMYMTTEDLGLWRTENATDANPTFTLVEDYPFRHPIRVFFNPNVDGEIWVTSFGGGLRVSK